MFRKVMDIISNRKFQSVLVLIGVIIGFLTWRYPVVETFNDELIKDNKTIRKDAVYYDHNGFRNTITVGGGLISIVEPPAELGISGSNVKVSVSKGEDSIAFENTHISSPNSEYSFYVPKGQRVELILSGAGAEVRIDKRIAQQIHIQDTGSNNKIRHF